MNKKKEAKCKYLLLITIQNKKIIMTFQLMKQHLEYNYITREIF